MNPRRTRPRSPSLHCLLAAAGYLLAHLLIRLGAPHGLQLDKAEQLLVSQWLQGGYSPQPPLYTWLQILVSQRPMQGPHEGCIGSACSSCSEPRRAQ